MDVTFVGPSTFATQTFIDTAGGAAEGAIVLADYFSGSPDPLNTQFVEAYKAQYGVMPDNWAAMGYALANLGIEAIKNAGPNPTREAVRAGLEGLREVPTVIGNHVWTMDDARNPHYGAAILKVEDNAFTLAP